MANFLAQLRIRLGTLYYSTITLLALGWRCLRVGPAVWRKVEHRLPPRLLTDYAHGSLRLPSGIRIHYVEAGPPDAPLMILVHGYPEFWYSWRFQIAHFSDRYRVVAIDQRGYGDSDKPADVAQYNVDILARDIKDCIEGLGYKSAVVGGHDWGGAVVWRVALRFPEVVSKLIVFNCPHTKVLARLLKTSKEQQSKSWYFLLFQAPYLPEFVVSAEDFKMFDSMFRGRAMGIRNREMFTDEDMEAWKYTFSQPGALSPPINYYRCMMQYPVTTLSSYKVMPPTLILWGTEDGALSKECGDLSAAECDNGRCVYIPGASHWVQQDAPARCNQEMDAFLSETPPVGRTDGGNKSHI